MRLKLIMQFRFLMLVLKDIYFYEIEKIMIELLNIILLGTFFRMGFNKSWQGDFDEHALNKNAVLIF